MIPSAKLENAPFEVLGNSTKASLMRNAECLRLELVRDFPLEGGGALSGGGRNESGTIRHATVSIRRLGLGNERGSP